MEAICGARNNLDPSPMFSSLGNPATRPGMDYIQKGNGDIIGSSIIFAKACSFVMNEIIHEFGSNLLSSFG